MAICGLTKGEITNEEKKDMYVRYVCPENESMKINNVEFDIMIDVLETSVKGSHGYAILKEFDEAHLQGLVKFGRTSDLKKKEKEERTYYEFFAKCYVPGGASKNVKFKAYLDEEKPFITYMFVKGGY